MRVNVLWRVMAMNPQTAMLNPAGVIASQQRRSAFTPEAGGFLIVQLPGESMRCEVKKVINEDTVIVKLGQPISKMHQFQLNDMVGVRRRVSPHGGRELWEAQRDREFVAEQERVRAMARPAAVKSAPAPQPEPTPAPQAIKKAAPKKTPAKKAEKKPAKKPVARKAPAKAPVAKRAAPVKKPAAKKVAPKRKAR